MTKEPHVDLLTHKIYNAEAGTKEYSHECGHLVFNELYSEDILNNQRDNKLLIWLMVTALVSYGFSKILGLIFSIASLIFVIRDYMFERREEKFCDDYADKQIKRGNK